MKIITKRSALMGFLCSLVGFVVGSYIAESAKGEGFEWFPLYAGLAAFLTSSLLWQVFIERKKTYKVLYGMLVGGVSGILSHYIFWYLLILGSNVQYFVFGTNLSSLGEPPMNLIQGFYGALVLSFWSLLIFGWLTVFVGAMIGGVYNGLLKKNR